MKKWYTFLFLLCAGISTSMAQNDFSYIFVDKNGNAIDDGATIVQNSAEEDEFGAIQIGSGLSVKNVGAPENYYIRLLTEITQIDNGSVQVCFPLNCFVYYDPGLYQSSETKMEAEAIKDIKSEWLPEAYGECIVTYQAMALAPMGFGTNYVEKGGPTVKVHYIYTDPASVTKPFIQTKAKAWFNLRGQQLPQCYSRWTGKPSTVIPSCQPRLCFP